MHDTFAELAERAGQTRPCLEGARSDRRFGQVVDDEPETGHLPGHDHARRQLPRAHQEVIGEVGRLDRGQPAPHVRDAEASPDRARRAPGGESRRATPRPGQPRNSIERPVMPGSVRSTQPITPPMNGDGRRGRQELTRLLQAADRLDEDRPIDPAAASSVREVLGSERRSIAASSASAMGSRSAPDPAGGGGRRRPGSCRRRRLGIDQALGPEFVPQSRGDRPAHERRVFVEMLDAPDARDQVPAYSGMRPAGTGSVRGTQRHAPSLACRRNSRRSVPTRTRAGSPRHRSGRSGLV